MKRRGLTLVEVLLSLALLSGAVLALLNLYPYSALITRRAGDRLQAGELAQALLADFGASAYTTLAVGTTAAPDVTLDGVTFHRKLEIWAPDGEADKLLAARATVSWSSFRADDTVSYEHYRVHLAQ